MKLQKTIGIILGLVLIGSSSVHAAAPAPVVGAKGVAVYGWKNGERIPLYIKNEHTVYPIASITKLITAKAALEFYKPDTIFTITKTALATEGSTPGFTAGAKFTRDDLLKALLVRSSNDAATAFMEPVGSSTFIKKMNSILHSNKYTSTTFSNPSGLDPAKKLRIKPNRMTPYLLTTLVNDIYTEDELLRDIMASTTAEITELRSNKKITLAQTNKLIREEEYRDRFMMSKTGLTNLAGQSVAFVTDGGDKYDYITVVLLNAKSRSADSVKIIDWLDTL